MSCEVCAGAIAKLDQLEGEHEAQRVWGRNLLERIQRADAKIESLERSLRETMDELRLRRQVTGYLPHLDTPLEN